MCILLYYIILSLDAYPDSSFEHDFQFGLTACASNFQTLSSNICFGTAFSEVFL